MNKQFFTQKYLIEGKSYAEIAKELGWCKSSVVYYLKKYNIPVQDPKKRQKQKTLKGEKHPMYGKRGKESHIFGRKHSQETRKKISQALMGEQNPMYRKKFSDTHKKRMADARKRQPRKPDHLRKTPFYRAIRVLPEYKKWRQMVFARDNFICRNCSTRGGTLNVDHVLPLSVVMRKHDIDSVTKALRCTELWDTDNGRTLCVDCHKKTKTYGGKIKRKNK